jgi:dihydrolipoamide dehydrogenase
MKQICGALVSHPSGCRAGLEHTMHFDYDVTVIGGGPGGYEAAIRCAQYNLKTALVEKRELGGTCLNRGCIPTKALLHGAQVLETVRSASSVGVLTEMVNFDFAKLSAYKDSKVLQLRRGIESLERANGVEIIRGFGRIIDAHTVGVEDTSVSTKNIILATGTEPAIPPIPGVDGQDIITSDDVLSMTELPESMIIVGGGVIGIEFATLFSTLDVEVTILEMMPSILPGVDPEISGTIHRLLGAKGVSIVTQAKVNSFHEGSVQYSVQGSEQTAHAQKIAVCTGRKPLTHGIGLENIGLTTQRGYISVDTCMRTELDTLYAIGDITGKMQLAHVASAQGLVAAANCAGITQHMRYDRIPACVYTDPEIAFIGLNESTAREKGRDIKVGRFPVSGNGRSAIMNEYTGFAKLIIDARTGEILGCQIFSPRATDLIAEIAAVMQCEGTVDELAATIHPHPTVSEILMEAAHDTDGLCCNAMPR